MAGVKIPKHRIPPPQTDEQAAVKHLTDAIAAYESYDGELAPHPFFGKISRDTWREIHLIHMAHHLSFLSSNRPAR
jgi:hypothetical protein